MRGRGNGEMKTFIKILLTFIKILLIFLIIFIVFGEIGGIIIFILDRIGCKGIL